MAKKREKKDSKSKAKPKVNEELEGFDIEIDTFGEIKTNFDIDKINEFLNRTVDDKKLRDRKDLPGPKKSPPDKEDSNKKK
ncbi:MAG: hypothetical protein OER04_18435 [Cyclobacteriaceae bacterium]|nr:hypothetical protein [Cyclobacteriaceae bacterium]